MEQSYLVSRNQSNTFLNLFTPAFAFLMTLESIVKRFIVFVNYFFGMADLSLIRS